MNRGRGRSRASIFFMGGKTGPVVPVLTAPTSFVVTAGDTENVLSWVDSPFADLDEVDIYRSTTSGSGFSLIDTVAAGVQGYIDDGLTNGTTYYYYLVSVDTSNNESPPSAERFGTPVDVTAPSAPSAFTTTAGDGVVYLEWTDPADADLDGINIYRSLTSGSGFTLLDTVADGVEEYEDEDVTNDTTYYYRLTAFDTSVNESSPSSEQSATPEEGAEPALAYGDWIKEVLQPIAFFRMADTNTTMVDEMGTVEDGAHDAAALVSPFVATSVGAHTFSGSTDSVFTQGPAFRNSEQTIAMWVRFANRTGTQSLWNGFNGAFTRGTQLVKNSGHQLLWYWGNGSTWANFGGSGTLANTTVYRIVGVIDTAESSPRMKLYVNGSLVGSTTDTFGALTSNSSAQLGSEDGGSFFNGAMWDVAIFNRALTAEEISEDYARGTDSVILNITEGGTYSGLNIVYGGSSPLITINTDEPVIIRDSYLEGRSILIDASNGDANVTLQRVVGVVKPRLANNISNARALSAEDAVNVVVENCTFENTAGIYILDFEGDGSPDETVRIYGNRFRNIVGFRSNGSGGYSGTKDLVQAIQLDKVTVANGEIAWNEVINVPYESQVEDIINIYQSGGASGNPLLIHHNLLWGAYAPDPAADSYSGGGIMCSDAGALARGYISAYDNIVMDTSNYGLAAAGGHDITINNNIIVSNGTLPDTTPIVAQNVGLYAWDMDSAGLMDDIVVTNNQVWWRNHDTDSYPSGRNDWWLPDADVTTGNTQYGTTPTHAVYEDLWEGWLEDADTEGVNLLPIGD